MNIQNQYNNIIYDIITKFRYKNIFEIPKITKIFLNISDINVNINKKNLINIIFLLKIITNQKPFLTKSKKTNVFLKIKKNSVVGCKVLLRKQFIYDFLDKIIFSNLHFKINWLENKNIINFNINNILDIFELKNEFGKFIKLPLNVSIHLHTNNKINNNNEFKILLNHLFILRK